LEVGAYILAISSSFIISPLSSHKQQQLQQVRDIIDAPIEEDDDEDEDNINETEDDEGGNNILSDEDDEEGRRDDSSTRNGT
jgi:hypothetical protein